MSLYFEERCKTPELMDDFKSDKTKLFNTIKQFWIINLIFSKSRFLIKKYIISEIKKNKKKTFTFLDIGAGGGDIIFWFYNICKKYNFNVKLYCLDYDKRIIGYLKNEIKKKNVKNIKIIFDSVFNLDKIGKFDFVFSNHFLHHFYDKDISTIIKKIKNATNNVFIINDLVRSKVVYFFHSIFASVFLRKSFTLYDGLISIKKGFIPEELSSIVKKIDKKIFVGKIFPIRVFLYYKK